MRSFFHSLGLRLLVALLCGFGLSTTLAGCGSNPNDEGLSSMESTVPEDAPESMEEYFEREQQEN